MVDRNPDTRSPAEYRKEARRLRTLAETLTMTALRQTLLDAAATYDKLATQIAIWRSDNRNANPPGTG
jgi:hypothetical protein